MNHSTCIKVLSNWAFIGLLIGCSSSPTKTTETDISPEEACMEKIIEKDDVLGTERNHACESISLAATIHNYTDSLSVLDYSHCPPAFTRAFEQHIAAWRAMIPLVEKYPDLRGEMHALFDQIEAGQDSATFKPLLKDIWDTWGDIEEAMGNGNGN